MSSGLRTQMCRCDVQTYCFGLAASMGAFLLGAGTKGKRYSMPNARIMIHQPLGGASGQARAAPCAMSLKTLTKPTSTFSLLSRSSTAAHPLNGIR